MSSVDKETCTPLPQRSCTSVQLIMPHADERVCWMLFLLYMYVCMLRIRPWYTVACMSWCVNVFISCLRANHLMQKWDTVPVEISHSSRMPGLRPCSTNQTLVSRGVVSLAISYAWECRSGHREKEVTKGIPAGFLHGFPVRMTSWCKFMGW